MNLGLHLVVLAVTAGFYSWAVWLANSRRFNFGRVQSFRSVVPFRVLALALSPFLLWASWQEWETLSGIVFLVMAVGMIPFAVAVWTLRIILGEDSIRLKHAFTDKRIAYDQISHAWLREWSGEYVIRSKDETTIVFPAWLENSKYVFKRCQSSMPPNNISEGASGDIA